MKKMLPQTGPCPRPFWWGSRGWGRASHLGVCHPDFPGKDHSHVRKQLDWQAASLGGGWLAKNLRMGLDCSCLGGAVAMRKDDAFGSEADLGLNPKSFIGQLGDHIQSGLWFSHL